MALIDEHYKVDIKHRSDFERTESGNLLTDVGLEKVKNKLIRRLVTVPGSIIHRPNFGVGILRYQNATLTFSQKEKIATNINDQFLEEPFVEEVLGVSFKNIDSQPDAFIISVSVRLEGYGESTVQYQSFEG